MSKLKTCLTNNDNGNDNTQVDADQIIQLVNSTIHLFADPSTGGRLQMLRFSSTFWLFKGKIGQGMKSQFFLKKKKMFVVHFISILSSQAWRVFISLESVEEFHGKRIHTQRVYKLTILDSLLA